MDEIDLTKTLRDLGEAADLAACDGPDLDDADERGVWGWEDER